MATEPRWLAGISGVAAGLFLSMVTGGLQGEVFLLGNVVSNYIFVTNMAGMLLCYSFCAYPFATVFGEEQEHKYMACSVARGNLKSYVASKAAVVYLSSTLMMLGGTLLFLLLCRTQVPWTDWELAGKSDYVGLLADYYGGLLENGHPLAYCMAHALNLGMLSGALSMAAALGAVFIRNRLLQLVTPVFAHLALEWVDVCGYGISSFYVGAPWESSLANLLTLFAVTAGLSILLAAAIYQRLKGRM